MNTRRVKRWTGQAAGIIGLSAVVALTSASPVLASSDHGNQPPGNNGTIKIDEYPMDGGNGNDPHVDCRFSVNFFGYDGGTQSAKLTFEGQAPTGGGVLQRATTTWTTTRRTAGNQLDTSFGPVDLGAALAKAGVAPAKLGYHVKVTVAVTGSKGNDTKHKVLWLQPCAPSAGAAPAAATPAPRAVAPTTPGSSGVAPAVGATGVAAPGQASPAPVAAPTAVAPVATATSAAAPAGAAVLGETVAAAQGPASADVGRAASASPQNAVAAQPSGTGSLPFTGARVLLLAICGAALVAAGTVAVRTARSRG